MVVTLFEHELVPFHWTDHDLVLLEQLRARTGVEVVRATVRNGTRVLQAAQHVGVLCFGKHTVQILPKMYRNAANANRRTAAATRNLLYLLSYAEQVPVREHDIAPLLRQNDNWFEILTRLFAIHLLEEWQRGAYRNYQAMDDELPVLKGKWRMTDQLRRPERRHLFAVTFDEFSADNQLNRIFRYVVERLWSITRNAETRQHLGTLRLIMDEVTLVPHVRVEDANPATLTRLNQRFAPLLNLARLFLENSSLQLAADAFRSFAFVLDMNQLFEAFVVTFVRRHVTEILPPPLHGCDLLPQTRGAQRHLATTGGKPVFRLKPDLAFRLHHNFPLLLDAKYKQLRAEDMRLGVSQDDFYQMHGYAHRYRCPRIILIYPQTASMDAPVQKDFTLSDCDTTITAGTIDLRVELAQHRERQALIQRLRVLAGIPAHEYTTT